MAHTTDHEIVSIYPFSDSEVDRLMTHAGECVLMWTTKDGWPVGVTHSFVWRDGKIWITFAAHRHRAAAIRRDNRVSVAVSSRSYRDGTAEHLPQGAITFKGRAAFFDDDATKAWFYPALSKKVNPLSAARCASRMAASSVNSGWAKCQPPKHSTDTLAPVDPSGREGMAIGGRS